MHTAGAVGRAAAGVVSEPFKIYKSNKATSNVAEAGPSLQEPENHRHELLTPMATAIKTERTELLAAEPSPAACSSNHASFEQHPVTAEGSSIDKDESRNGARQVVKASAKNVGKLLFSPVKGLVLDIPLAAVEGMWNLPRFQGDTGYQHTAVTDWKSGGSVAVKSFTHGVHEGMTDIFVKTYAGKKKEGAKGVAKGLSMGLVNLTMKTGAGTLGLVVYPCQGIYKSVHMAMHTKVKKAIERAKLEEGEWLLENELDNSVKAEDVLRRFLSMKHRKGDEKI